MKLITYEYKASAYFSVRSFVHDNVTTLLGFAIIAISVTPDLSKALSTTLLFQAIEVTSLTFVLPAIPSSLLY